MANKIPSDDDKTTRIITRQDSPLNSDFVRTPFGGPHFRSDDTTVPTPGDMGRTRLAQPGGGEGSVSSQGAEDPVVGWLVIVSGPGRGRSLIIGHGVNSIGRAPTERICIDFGDEKISRVGHAQITYDQRHRKFYVQHGGGVNLSYLSRSGQDDEAPLLAPTELTGGEHLQIGDTVLRFVPLCGPDFDWVAR